MDKIGKALGFKHGGQLSPGEPVPLGRFKMGGGSPNSKNKKNKAAKKTSTTKAAKANDTNTKAKNH